MSPLPPVRPRAPLSPRAPGARRPLRWQRSLRWPGLWPAILITALSLPVPAWSHPGHDHGTEPAPVLLLDPRAEAHGDGIELVLILEGETLVLYLDEFATNAPIAGAEVMVEATTADGPREDHAVAALPGQYRLEAPWLRTPGHHDLLISVRDATRFDLLTARLTVPPPPADGDAAEAVGWWQLVAALLAVFALGLVAGGLLRGAREPDSAAMAAEAGHGQ